MFPENMSPNRRQPQLNYLWVKVADKRAATNLKYYFEVFFIPKKCPFEIFLFSSQGCVSNMECCVACFFLFQFFCVYSKGCWDSNPVTLWHQSLIGMHLCSTSVVFQTCNVSLHACRSPIFSIPLLFYIYS